MLRRLRFSLPSFTLPSFARLSFTRLSFTCAFALALVACGSSDAQSTSDAGADTFDEAFVAPDTATDTALPSDTGPAIHCTLDNGGDPVGFCTQKIVFEQWHEAAVIKDLGVAQSWDSKTFLPDKDSSGAVLHDAHDDARFLGAAARYLASGHRYGDNEIELQTFNDLLAVAKNVEAEFAAPDGTEVDVYADLRDAANELRTEYVDTTYAPKLDAIADAIGNAIYANTWHELGAIPPPPPGDAGDAGADATTDATVDATIDATTDTKADTKTDAGADGGVPLVDGILGQPSGSGFDYEPWKVAYGAAALLDMAARHPTDANATNWQRAAIASLDHVLRRAREPGTQLLYSELVTSGDVDHDTLAGADPTDALQTDNQAAFALGASRAQSIVDASKTAFAPNVAAYPYAASAASLLESTDGVPIWDGDKGGYLDGFVPSTSSTIDRKSTRGNALMFAAIHRLQVQSSVPKTAAHIKTLRTVLLQRTPESSSLLSVVADQGSYLVASSPAFDLSGIDDPRGKSFFSSADAVACEGLWEQWFGAPK